MPYTKIGIPRKQLEIEDELRERYGGAMSKVELSEELSLSRPVTDKWVQGLPCIRQGRLYKYRVRDVARKIYQSMEGV